MVFSNDDHFADASSAGPPPSPPASERVAPTAVALDDKALEILAAIPRDGWVNTDDIAEAVPHSIATVYRRIDAMMPYLTTRENVEGRGQPRTEYQRVVDQIVIDFETADG